MPWCDGHLDLAFLAVNGRDLSRENIDLATGCVTFPALREAEVRWCFGTIFTEPGDPASGRHVYAGREDREGAERAGLLQVAEYERWEHTGEVRLVRSRADLECIDDGATPGVIILMEGADPIRQPSDAAKWHARGVRIVGLAWARGSRYADGNGPPPSTNQPREPCHGGLSAEGRELVQRLDDLGMIHDASHLSDAAFDDLLETARGPIIASHSNCRSLVDDWQRHLRDDQIRSIADRGGVIGLNLFSRFLSIERRATVDDCLAHIERIAAVAGRRDVVALGSDMDGGFEPDKLPIGLDHPTRLGALEQGLQRRGWSDTDIAGFTHRNWLRFLQESLP